VPLLYPTPLHERAAAAVHAFFQDLSVADTVLVVKSCARGTAVAESDLDMAVLLAPDVSIGAHEQVWHDWLQFRTTSSEVAELCGFSQFSAMHLELVTGNYEPQVWDDNGGPDDFDVRIGNDLAFSVVLGLPGAHLQDLRARWLPFYDDALFAQRLEMARAATIADIDCIRFYVDRGQYLQAFDRLYKAYREFLQTLFIARKQYPLGYDRFLREQVVDLLGEPEIFQRLIPVLEVEFAGRSIINNGERLRDLALGV